MLGRSIFAALFIVALAMPADAAGWAAIYRFVHKSGKCTGGHEVLASFYMTGTRTASGEPFNMHGLTAASHDYQLGTTITATNPFNGRSCSIRINDRGPYGIARQMGARIDFALGAARCLGMTATQFICAP
jgi:rare lipoprotein A (peptidoglycan hydrolase)